MYFIICGLLCFMLNVCAKNEDYKGYQVYNIRFENEEQQAKFYLLKSDLIEYLRKPSLKYDVVGQALVPPSHFNWFEDKLQELGVARNVQIDDVFEYLLKLESQEANSNTMFDFDGYYRYDKIFEHMQKIEALHENSTEFNLNVINAGVTDEGRPLVYLKLAKYSNQSRPVVIIEAGINPREWITVPAALNVVNKLVENGKLLENFVWIIIPVANPDGYEYTHTNLRFWSKSRSTRSNLGQICPGVNLNRNFDIDWSFSDSSSSPCSHLYAGVEPFSEPETRFLRSFIQEYGRNITLYFSLQNTGGFISYPWQYERAATGMFRQHFMLGNKMAAALNGDYGVDIGSLIYGDRASGTSTDYFTMNEVLYAFTIDVAPKGSEGVEVPVNEIRHYVDKVWTAVSIAAESLIK